MVMTAARVHAQATYHVIWSKIEAGSWRWTALYALDAGQTQVHSVVAILDPAAATGDNLQVVWYIRGEPWTSQSWTTTDPWKAINSM
jgi:hypothetical protein